MARSVVRRRGSVLGSRSEHDFDEHRILSSEHSERCRHRLLSVVPVVSIRVEGGYKSRCLLCGTIGPTRSNSEAVRGVLLDQLVGAEE
jgi:hypothetical protein